MDLIERIKRVGLNQKEAKIYLALMELGSGTVQDICKRSGLKRTTIYPFLQSLVRQNYVSVLKQENNRHLFVAETPDRLLADLQLRAKQFKGVLPLLKDIVNDNKTRPKTFFFHGPDAHRKFYDDTLNLPRNLQICEFVSMQGAYKYITKEYAKDYIKTRVKKRIRSKMIAIDSPETRELYKNAAKELREAILIPAGNCDLSGALEIYGNRVSVISWSEDFTGFIIESKRMADMLKLAFEMMWQGARMQAVAKFEFGD